MSCRLQIRYDISAKFAAPLLPPRSALRLAYPWSVMIAVVTFVGILGSVEKDQAMAGCDCKQRPAASSCAPRWDDHSRCWGVCGRGEKGQRRIPAARKAPQFLSNGHLVGPAAAAALREVA